MYLGSVLEEYRYLCSKNKSDDICYKFAIIVKSRFLPCVLYHWREKKAGYFVMYCLSVCLNKTERYCLFSNMVVDHWCLSLT